MLGFPAVWLRHNCPCPDCRDPVTGQRLVELSDIPIDVAAAVTDTDTGSVEVVFAPDGHRAVFGRGWLAAHALPADGLAEGGTAQDGPARRGRAQGGLAQDGSAEDTDPRTEDGKRLWRAADLDVADLPGAAWNDYLGDDAVRESCLDAVARLGLALLRGVPAEPGMVTRVAETFGFVRETNYGRLFDVRVVPDPANLAFTSREIPPHTDNPYRDPVPTLQLLHCLRDAASGGDTGLVDGFAAAAALRAEDPSSFRVLTTTAWPFAYVDKETELRAAQPLISLTPAGRITAVRLNNRSMEPLRLPQREAEAAYAAYRVWDALLARPEFRLTFRLTPGDCLIFDNTRILHARTAFASDGASAGGERHLQGCYADIDGLLSTLAVLRRARDW